VDVLPRKLRLCLGLLWPGEAALGNVVPPSLAANLDAKDSTSGGAQVLCMIALRMMLMSRT